MLLSFGLEIPAVTPEFVSDIARFSIDSDGPLLLLRVSSDNTASDGKDPANFVLAFFSPGFREKSSATADLFVPAVTDAAAGTTMTK